MVHHRGWSKIGDVFLFYFFICPCDIKTQYITLCIESSNECVELANYLSSNSKIRIFYNQKTKKIAKDIANLLKNNDFAVPNYINSDI